MRNRVVRFQLVALAVLAVLVAGRFFKGLPSLEGELTILDIDVGELERRSFTLAGPAEISVTAYGSVERETSAPVAADLAAYPWIVRKGDRMPIWRMDPAQGEVVKGTLLRVDDTVRLDEGEYDLYYASYGTERYSRRGGPFLRLGGHWTADSKNWQVALSVPPDAGLREISSDEVVQASTVGEVVWSSGPMEGRRMAEQLVSVSAPTPVSIYSIGEFCDGEACDWGWIEDLETGERVWQMSEDNTVFAGGSRSNRLFDGIVTLPPGNYKVAYRTDAGHAYNEWFGNPPFDPSGWGVRVATTRESDSENVQVFDLWKQREAVVRMSSVRDDEERSSTFRVLRETPVVVYSMGEFSSGSAYDYGWIDDDRGNTIWQMSWDASKPAGGARKNRVEVAYLVLKPGRYVANYRSDGSHSFEDWNSSRPKYPERWGLTVFLLDDADATNVVVEGARPIAESSVPALIDDSRILVDLTPAGNDVALTHSFSLDDEVEVVIHALGEITMADRYDYATLIAADGNVVWTMTRDNTVAMGEGERLRRFDGRFTLGPGSYTAQYRTDDSYAFGDFEGGGPARPHDYGVRILLAGDR